MSGHSKWSQIKRSKGVADAKKGQIFTKLTREIMVAVRSGGADPEANFRLRLAIQKAKDSSMPYDNIDRAIKKAMGGGEGSALQEVTYEGYGAGGTGILVNTLTDNRMRTLQEIRTVFTRGGGSLAEAGSVSWQFRSKGLITAEPGSMDPEELGLYAIDSGAEDVKIEKGYVEIITDGKDLELVRKALEPKGVKIISAEVSLVPQATVKLDEKSAVSAMKLLDKLEEMDDVQKVSSNAEFSDEVLEALKAVA
ncbi:MAG: YebC/PmpR family DNA-binding transcriptional regulator [Chloroflexi bacterium]|nr:YebC/PmpR family DNA-binding transcriptional regulator [Chloroflexota bacterium]